MPTTKLAPVRALIFDLDGTLIDSEKDLVLSVNAMLRQLGRAELAEETISGYIGQGAPVLIARALGNGAAGAVTDEEQKRALQFFLGYYEEHKMDNTRAYPGVAEALAELRGYPMAVLTNKPHRISRRILEALGLAGYFRAIYGGNSFETKKPDPLGAQTILHEFGVAPGEALLIGDSEIDVQTARNAGTLAAVVTYGFGVYDRTAHPADVYLDSLTALIPMLRWDRG
jgi:phosphoglycolate phosphatase